MNDHSNEALIPRQLSRIRTVLFGALTFVWFSEMALWGFQSLSKMWTVVWHIIPPANPQLAMVLSITQAVEAPAKGALGILAIFGLRSKNPTARAALFLSMALVPPLNIAFPMRAAGFPFGSIAVATVFSAILWGSFFLFRESDQQPGQSKISGSGHLPPTRWEIFQYLWFAANSAALTLMAFLFLFRTETALHFVFPCLSTLLNTSQGELASLVRSGMQGGTHLLALATASWIGTVYSRRNPTIRWAVTIASLLHAGLMGLMPLRQLFLEVGGKCAASSILVPFVPLFAGWVLYAAFSYRVEHKKQGVNYGQNFRPSNAGG